MESQEGKKRAIKREWKRLFVFCLSFFLCFVAFRGLRDIQSTLNLTQSVGFASLTVLYASSLLAGLTLPAVVRCQLGTKWGLVLGVSLFAVYTASNYWSSAYLLLTVALFPGVGAALIWVARGTYITTISMEMAHFKGRNSAVDIGLFNGIFHTVSYLGTVCGNLISSLVFYGQPGDEDDGDDVSSVIGQWNASAPNAETADVSFCGMRACGGDIESNHSALRPPDQSTRTTLISIYLACGVLSATVAVVFLDKIDAVEPGTRLSGKEEEVAADGERPRSTWREITANIAATFRLMTNPRMAMLIPTLLYLGVDVMFMGGHFTKFFVGCTRGIEVVGYVMMGSSVSSCISSFLIGRLMKCVSRFALFIVGGATYLLVLVFMLVWDPDQGRLWHLVLMAVAVGFARASIATISSTLLGMLFVCQQEAAFGNLCFWQSLGSAAILALGIPPSMCAYHVISIVMCILVFALGMYCLLELRLKRERTPGEKKPEKEAEGKEMTSEMLAIAEATNNEISID